MARQSALKAMELTGGCSREKTGHHDWAVLHHDFVPSLGVLDESYYGYRRTRHPGRE